MIMDYIINRIFLNRDVFFPFKIMFDKFLFLFFYKKYYQKKFKYYGNNVKWGRDSVWNLIPMSVRISNPDKIQIGDNCMIDDNVYLQAHHDSEGLYIGQNSRINAFVHIQAYSKIQIDANVLIAPFCHINSGNHGFDDKEVPIMYQVYQKGGEIYIGKGTWLGRNATILGGVCLGKNCVIATAAVVTKSFPDYSIVGGIPARIIK